MHSTPDNTRASVIERSTRIPPQVKTYRDKMVPSLRKVREKLLALWEMRSELGGLLDGSPALTGNGNYTSVLKFVEAHDHATPWYDTESAHPGQRTFELLLRDLELLANPDILQNSGVFAASHNALVGDKQRAANRYTAIHPNIDLVRGVLEEGARRLQALEQTHQDDVKGAHISALREIVQNDLLSEEGLKAIEGFIKSNPGHLQTLADHVERHNRPNQHEEWRARNRPINRAEAEVVTGWKI